MKYDIFISYRRTDRAMADALVEKLRAKGVSVWIDTHIEGGADWRETIVDALSNSDMLVILFTDECNDSRQLKKELAIADDMQKPVVPILLEDTRPRGAYLYELADRNWIQAWPTPETHYDRIVEHLVLLSQKTSDGLSGVAPPLEAPVETQEEPAPAPNPAPPAASSTPPAIGAPTAPASYVGRSSATRTKLRDVVPFRWVDLLFVVLALIGSVAIEGAYLFRNSGGLENLPFVFEFHGGDIFIRCGVLIAAYCAIVFPLRGRSADGPRRSDILPFRRMDLFILIPVLIGLTVFHLNTAQRFNWGLDFRMVVDSLIPMIAQVFLTIVIAYSAVVFPVRYFMRRLPLRSAVLKYLVSSLILLALCLGAPLLAGGEAFGWVVSEARGYILAWLTCSVVAFAIYGALSGVRAMRSFRANLKTV